MEFDSVPRSDQTSGIGVQAQQTTQSLSPAAAFAALVIYTLLYVLPLYASPRTRPSPSLSRDDEGVIRARIKSALASTSVCSLATYLLLRHIDRADISMALHAMGYWPLGVKEAAKSLLLTGILFSAPLFEMLLLDGFWGEWTTLRPLLRLWSSWTTWRNIVIGPITEELLFRSASIPLFIIARVSVVKTIFLSPVVFGLAHIHHFYEFRITHPNVPVTMAVARSVLQFSYTSLFGAYATFIFLRTGSVLSATLAHALCNSIGLPRFWGPVEPYWLNGHSSLTREAAARKWTILYYVLLVAGAWGWWISLMPLTMSPSHLVGMEA